VTIFGASWHELSLEHLQSYLDQADDEPLLWEAKGTRLDPHEVRRQVCGFANSHEGGFLILGAESTGPGEAKGWALTGVPFPDEPRTWVSPVVGDLERGVRPLPDFDVQAWRVAEGHVAVVRVRPTSTPPCITNGTVYERVPGKTQTVREPMQLAALFARGDEARSNARARADRAAETVLDRWLPPRFPANPLVEGDGDDDSAESPDFVRFVVGMAATGNPPNISGRLFKNEFAEELWTRLRARPSFMPPEFRQPPDPVFWSQDALTWRHYMRTDDALTVVRASWDGAAAVGQLILSEDVYPDSFVQNRVVPQWGIADEIVSGQLGGFGDVYVTVMFLGGRFPRRTQDGPIVMRRGPIQSGIDEAHASSLGRELMRAVGNIEPEPPEVEPEQD
jgi:hypothetical protein